MSHFFSPRHLFPLYFLSFSLCSYASVIQFPPDSVRSSSDLARAPTILKGRNTDPRSRACSPIYGRPSSTDCTAAIAQLPTADLDALKLFGTRFPPGFGADTKVRLPLKLTAGTCILEITIPIQGYVAPNPHPRDDEIGELLPGYDSVRANAEFETYREVINVADEIKQTCVAMNEGGKQRLGQNLALQVKLYSPGSTYALQRQLSGLDPGMPGYTTAQRLLSESIQALGPPPATSANNVASTSQVACTDETNCMEGWTCEVQHNTQTYLYTGTFFPNLQWCEAWLNEAWQAYLNFIDEVQDKFNG